MLEVPLTSSRHWKDASPTVFGVPYARAQRRCLPALVEWPRHGKGAAVFYPRAGGTNVDSSGHDIPNQNHSPHRSDPRCDRRHREGRTGLSHEDHTDVREDDAVGRYLLSRQLVHARLAGAEVGPMGLSEWRHTPA